MGESGPVVLRVQARVEGKHSRRPFDPTTLVPPIRVLTTHRVRLTATALDVIERHIERFEEPIRERAMLDRLERCVMGNAVPLPVDLRFYTHELRESVRYRLAGYPTGQPLDPEAQYELWNNMHTATLEDYRLREGPGVLYADEVEGLQR